MRWLLWITSLNGLKLNLATFNVVKLKEFVFRAIGCRFGMPCKLISDNGKQFDIKEMRKLCEDLHIQKGFSTMSSIK